MSDEPKTPPIIEQEYLAGLKVVDIGDLRVARGKSRRYAGSCPHKRLVYDQQERRIWCKDCETDIEGFDAFVQVCGQFDGAARKIERQREEIEAARAHNIRSIAAKRMDEHFRSRKHVPMCPHCNEAIFPEDVAKMGSMGREFAQAKRNKKERPDG